MKTKIKNIKKRFFFGLNLIKVSFSNTFKFFAIFIPSWTHTKRFLTAFMISIFFLSQYGYIYDEASALWNYDYLKWIRCVIRNRPQADQEIELLKKDESLREEDKYCLNDPTYKLINGSLITAPQAYNTLLETYKAVYGYPEEFLATTILTELDKPSTGLEESLSKMEKNVTGDGAEFNFKDVPTDKSSLRYIFEFYTRPSEETGLGNPQESIFHSHFYKENTEVEFFNHFNEKLKNIKIGLLQQFMSLYTVLHVNEMRTAPFDKSETAGDPGIDFLNDLTEFLTFQDNKDGDDYRLSHLGEIRKADQACTGDSCKAAKGLANAGARLVLDIYLMSKLALSSNLGNIDGLDDNKLLMREYYTSLGGDFLSNKAGFMRIINDGEIDFIDKGNDSNLIKYFEQIKYKKGAKETHLGRASAYWEYLNESVSKDIESAYNYKDKKDQIKRYHADGTGPYTLAGSIMTKDNLCDEAGKLEFDQYSGQGAIYSWPFFVFDPTESGDYTFNFRAAISAIDEVCYQGKVFNDFKDYTPDKDGQLHLNIKYPRTVTTTTGGRGARTTERKENGYIVSALNSEGIILSFSNDQRSLPTEGTWNADNNATKKAGIITAARKAYLSFNRYYEGQNGSWFTVGKNNENYLGYNTILKALNTEKNAINTLFGNFVSDYIALHSTAYGEYKDVVDPTDSVDFNMFKISNWLSATIDVLYSPVAFFQTMFCDVNQSWGCWNPILAQKKSNLKKMADIVNQYVTNITKQITQEAQKIGDLTLEDTKDPNKMHEYETNILRILAKTTLLDNGVRSLFSEIIQVSNWVDNTRTFYLVAQIATDVIMIIASFGSYGLAKLMSASIMKALKSAAQYLKIASAGKFLISNPVSRVVWGMLRYFGHPFQQINLARYKIWALFTKQGEGLSTLQKGILLAGNRVAKAESTISKLEGLGKITKTGFKSWDSVVGFRIRWNTFLVNVNKGPQKFMQVRQSYKEYVQIKKALAGKEDDFLNKLGEYEKTLKTDPKITTLEGKVLAGEEAKIYANTRRTHLEMENPKKYSEWLKSRNKLTAEMEAELGDFAKYTQEWTEAGPLIKSLEGKIEANLSPQEIKQIWNTSDETVIKKIQDALGKDTDDIITQQKAIEDILNAMPVKPNNSSQMASQFTTKSVQKKELKDTLDKLIKEGNTMTGPERGEALLKLKNGFGDDISADLKNIITKTEETLKAPIRAEIKLENNALSDENIKLIHEIDNTPAFGTKKIETFTDIDSLKKHRDVLAQTPANGRVVGMLDDYIKNAEKIIINNKLLKDTFWFNKLMNNISKFKQAYTLGRALSILKSTWDIGRYSLYFLKDGVRDCNGDIIDPPVNMAEDAKGLLPEKVNKSLTNIYGEQNPEWLKNIQDILDRNAKIRSEMIPNVYQNLLILKEFSRQNMNKELDGFQYTDRLFNVVKANLLQSLNNLNSELFKFKINLSPCPDNNGGTTNGQNLDGCLPHDKTHIKTPFMSGFFNRDWLKADSNVMGRDKDGNPCLLFIGNLNIGAFNAFAGGQVMEDGAEQIISRIIKIFMVFAGSFAVLAIVYAGLLYTYSNGEEENLNKAKDIWFNAIIGLLITMLSYFIVSVIEGVLYAF